MCPKCGHPPLKHEPDGLGSATCMVCAFLRTTGNQDSTFVGVCTERFTFKLSWIEQQQAKRAAKDSYAKDVECTECGREWMTHDGYLCPDGNSTFIPLVS